jgi:hypothetical protein
MKEARPRAVAFFVPLFWPPLKSTCVCEGDCGDVSPRFIITHAIRASCGFTLAKGSQVMCIRSVSVPSILVATAGLGLLHAAVSAGAPVASSQDHPSSFEQDFLERQQEQMQAMQERLEQSLKDAVAQQRPKPFGVIPAARPNQSALGVAVGVPTRVELGACGFRPGVGLKVEGVLPGSPAAGASLRKGDLIESIQGQWIFNRDQLVSLIRSFPPGEQVRIKGVRNGLPFERSSRLVRTDALLRSGETSDSSEGYDFQSASDSDRQSSSSSSSDSDSDRQSTSSSSSDSDSDRQSTSSSSSDSDSDRQSSSSSSSDSDSDRQSSSSSSSDSDSDRQSSSSSSSDS